jgi:OOP family OmpA-OmpF porin
MAQQYTKNQGYLVDQNYNVVMAIGAGVCVRTSDWTPALAAAAEACKVCTPDQCPKPPAPKPAPPKPAEKPKPPPKPEILNIEQKIELQGIEFDKVPLTDQNKKDLDDWLAKDLKGVKLGALVVTGHTDALGSLKYNQKLSEDRAKYAKDYLVGKGIDQKLIFWEGKAFKQPVPVTKFCDPKKMSRKQLIECYAPNRRVTVEAVGTKEKPAPKPKPEAKPEAKK